MFIRQLHYLAALAREQHFTRAAEACNVSQPALSAAIKQLEDELGIGIIQRGQKFQGLTSEGERLLIWARRIIADWENMAQEAAGLRGQLTGTLRLGAIPTVLPVMPLLIDPSLETYPDVNFKLLSLSAGEIIQGLDHFELDLGLTYLEDQRLQGFRTLPLFNERYVLLTRDGALLEGRESLGWKEAAELPLCMLTPDMQNRRIIDAAFRDAGVSPRPCVETDSIFALYAHVRCAGLSSIVPHSTLCLFEMRQEVRAVPMEPVLSRRIGLVAPVRQTPSPVSAAVWSIFQQVNLQARFDAMGSF